MSLLQRVVAVALVLIAAVGAACAAPPDALGPEAPAAKAQGFVGKLAVAPLHGPAGTPLAVTGDGFGAGQKIELVWRTVDGKWKAAKGEYHGREYKPVGYRIATVTTDAAGTFSERFAAPDDFGFEHDIVAQQGGRLLTQTGFSLDMTLRVTRAARPARPSRSMSKASAGANSRIAGCWCTTTALPAGSRR